MNINTYRLQDKKLYLVTSSDQFENDDKFLNAIASALKGGVKILQLREKNASALRIIELGKKIRILCSMYGALFIINDRADITKILEADGVHLEQDSVDVDSAREILGPNFIVGISAYSPEQSTKAQVDCVDYILFEPVFETAVKPRWQALGQDYLKWAAENIEVPYFVFGGIDSDNVNGIVDSVAIRVAVSEVIICNENPEKAAELILKKLK